MTTPPIPWTHIKVLSFDIYGTLIDWETGIYTSLLSSPLGPHLPSSRPTVLEAFEDHERAVQAATPALPQRLVQVAAVRRYAADLGLVPDVLSQADVDKAAESFADGLGAWPAFEDTVAAMQRLGRYYKLAALSNIDNASLAQTLSGPLNGVKFDALYTAQDIGSYKPARANFDYLLSHVATDFGVEQKRVGEELCHVAQSLFHDHEPMNRTWRVGVSTVWVDRKGVMGARPTDGEGLVEEYGFRLRVESLGELADVVEEAWEGKV